MKLKVFLLVSILLIHLSLVVNAQEEFKNKEAPAGKWYGKLILPGTKIRFRLVINKTSAATYEGIQNQIGANVPTLPFPVIINGNQINFTDNINAKFVGTFTDSSIVGVLYDRGEPYEMAYTSFPLYEDKENTSKEPPMPITFSKKEFIVEYGKENINIAGTFFNQFRKGKVPTIFLLSPGGPHMRFADVDTKKPYLDMANFFAQRGYNVVCFDDRGQGKSTGDFFNTNITEHINDAQMVINYIKTWANVDTNQLIVIGHSQGGYFATELAKKNKGIFAVITLATSLENEKNILLNQIKKSAVEKGLDSISTNNLQIFYSKIYDAAIKQSTNKTQQNLVEQYLNTNAQILKQNMSNEEFINLKKTILAQVNNKYFRSTLNVKPSTTFNNFNKPLLMLFAEKDEYINNATTIQLAKKALLKNKKHTLGTMRGMNHNFQECTLCTAEESEMLPEAISKKVLNQMAEWLYTLMKQ